jgi:hypothetical protein
MIKEKAKEIIKPGWHDLLDKVYAIADVLPFAKITDIKLRYAMLQIVFASSLDKHEQYVLDSIAYKIERDSARICQECGNSGSRRKEIPDSLCLCAICYTLQYNELMESVSPQVTNQEPQ